MNQLVQPTGMNNYANSLQAGFQQGQKRMAKQTYAQKFKEVTGLDSTGDEKTDAMIFQKTMAERMQTQSLTQADQHFVAQQTQNKELAVAKMEAEERQHREKMANDKAIKGMELTVKSEAENKKAAQTEAKVQTGYNKLYMDTMKIHSNKGVVDEQAFNSAIAGYVRSGALPAKYLKGLSPTGMFGGTVAWGEEGRLNKLINNAQQQSFDKKPLTTIFNR